jgi:hypothetical protein
VRNPIATRARRESVESDGMAVLLLSVAVPWRRVLL